MEKTSENRKSLKFRHYQKYVLSLGLGAMAGFAYYYFVGNNSGSSQIWSNPFWSALAGGLFGFLVVNSPCLRGKC